MAGGVFTAAAILSLALSMRSVAIAAVVCPALKHSSLEGRSLPANVDFSIEPAQPKAAVLTFDHEGMSYVLADPLASAAAEPTEWVIIPGGSRSIRVSAARSGPNPGVVAIRVKVSGIDIPRGCLPLDTTWSVNTGLNDVARLRVDGDGITCDSHCDSIGKPALITVGDHAPFTLSLVGIDRTPLHLNGSLTLRARSREAAIRANDNLGWTMPWSRWMRTDGSNARRHHRTQCVLCEL